MPLQLYANAHIKCLLCLKFKGRFRKIILRSTLAMAKPILLSLCSTTPILNSSQVRNRTTNCHMSKMVWVFTWILFINAVFKNT